MKKQVIIILHAAYWLLYLLLLALLISLVVLGNGRPRPQDIDLGGIMTLLLCFAIVPGALGFYFFYSFLFNRFLSRKRILQLFLSGIIAAVLCGITGSILSEILQRFAGIGFSIFSNGWNSAMPLLVLLAINALLNGGMGLVVKAFIKWYGDIKLKEELQQKNHEAELELIHARLNPHFLFNTINNIDVLISIDQEKASEYLNKLSYIMRFMLYETGGVSIPLEKEIAYIEKYVALQRIRVSAAGYVRYSATGNAAGKSISPLLFIPFIENAFKHSEGISHDNTVEIQLTIEDEKVEFTCSNRYYPAAQKRNDVSGGLGNELIAKRLELLYPEKHKLQVLKEDERYLVYMTVDI